MSRKAKKVNYNELVPFDEYGRISLWDVDGFLEAIPRGHGDHGMNLYTIVFEEDGELWGFEDGVGFEGDGTYHGQWAGYRAPSEYNPDYEVEVFPVKVEQQPSYVREDGPRKAL